eukprot:Nk52_evm53s352 gene=Nk52_evmTU53s352
MGMSIMTANGDSSMNGDGSMGCAPKVPRNGTKYPNILVCGTPGTGKTTFCELLVATCEELLRHVNIGDLVKEKKLDEGYDEEYECLVIDEDAVCDEIEEMMTDNNNRGGLVVDYHGCDFFPERWFDLVIVLKTNNTTLYDRLSARGYSQKKLEKNVECEIMEAILAEALDSYSEDIVKSMQSDTIEDMEQNVTEVGDWFFDFTK